MSSCANFSLCSSNPWNDLTHLTGAAHQHISSGCKKVKIFTTEAFCVLTQVLPNALTWVYRVKCSSQLSVYPLKTTVEKTDKWATLYFHGPKNRNIVDDIPAVLFVHGDGGHPYTLLPLAEKVKQTKECAVFSLHMPFDIAHTTSSQNLMRQAIDKIEMIIKEHGGRLDKLITVGHSKGAIQTAYSAFVEQDQRIKAAIAIGGRLKVVESIEKPCPSDLKPVVHAIYSAIQKKPDLPLYQIVPGADWNAPLEAMAIRPQHGCCRIIADAMHLNVLYKKETMSIFDQFLGSALQTRNSPSG